MASEGSELPDGDEVNHVARCPYCLSPMETQAPTFGLPVRLNAIFSHVAKAGPTGIDLEELRDKVIPGRSSATLRSAICRLNKKISPMNVATGRSGKYYLHRNK